MSRILIVEDDQIAQDLLAGVLHEAGYEADVAPDGFAALRLLRENIYRVAFIDYHLPAMDGYALAKLMRDATRGNVPLKLVVVTADRHGLVARRDVDTVFDAMLFKPFERQAAIDMVEKAVGAGREPPSRLREVAVAFISNPSADRARRAAALFWRARGLAGLPKVHVLPEPSADQVAEINLCFDLVPPEQAELILLTGADGLALLRKARGRHGASLPVVTVDRSLANVADLVFRVDDPSSWSALAARLRDGEAHRLEMRG